MSPSRQSTETAATPSREAPSYYGFRPGDLMQQFKDFDSPEILSELEARVRSSRCKNIVLDYSSTEAWCALDVSGPDLTSLLNTRRPASISSRWIHLWYPHLQHECIDALTRTYQFSPRLAGLMRSNPKAAKAPMVKDDDHHHHFHWRHTSSKSTPRVSVDSEKGRKDPPRPAEIDSQTVLENLGHYDIVNTIWHWSSIDLGRKYLCLGYNTLHNVTSEGWATSEFDLPNGERIWNWLILCDDKTVVSISESNLAAHDVDASRTRHNLLNVFRQLSTATDISKRNPISIVPVRHSLGEENDVQTDTAGLLFYYLFDDWYSTYSLLAKGEYQYGSALTKLREDMMKHAELSHVEQLFRIGRQLATLKRMYQSYELLISKVLDKQDDHASLDVSSPVQHIPGIRRQSSSARELLGVDLSPEALVRFERLRDRIRLYVLSEIQECIDTKDSLVMMNFNLITIKESDAVERLTRITILLAKVTIMFLPVSLMTSYFSVQIPDQHFTISAYWISFAVVLAVSFVVLVVFGLISGTTEGNMVYRPVYKVAMDIVRGTLARKKTA